MCLLTYGFSAFSVYDFLHWHYWHFGTFLQNVNFKGSFNLYTNKMSHSFAQNYQKDRKYQSAKVPKVSCHFYTI